MQCAIGFCAAAFVVIFRALIYYEVDFIKQS